MYLINQECCWQITQLPRCATNSYWIYYQNTWQVTFCHIFLCGLLKIVVWLVDLQDVQTYFLTWLLCHQKNHQLTRLSALPWTRICGLP